MTLTLRDVKARANRQRRKRRNHRRRRRLARVIHILKSIYADGLRADFNARSPLSDLLFNDSIPDDEYARIFGITL